MQITVKVFVTLRKYLDSKWSQKPEFQVSWEDLPGDPKRIHHLIDYLKLPEQDIGQIILNGHIKWDKTIELRPNDRVILQPPIGGG